MYIPTKHRVPTSTSKKLLVLPLDGLIRPYTFQCFVTNIITLATSNLQCTSSEITFNTLVPDATGTSSGCGDGGVVADDRIEHSESNPTDVEDVDQSHDQAERYQQPLCLDPGLTSPRQ